MNEEIAARFARYRHAGLPDNAFLIDYGERMKIATAAYSQSQYRNPDHDFMSALSERRLAYLLGGDYKPLVKGRGDGHVDRILTMRDGRDWPADVKCAVNPKEIIVWVKDMEAFIEKYGPEQRLIFILAGLINHKDDNGEPTPKLEWDAELLCWDWDVKLRKSIPKTHGFNLKNYWVPNPFHNCYKDAPPPNSARDIYELLALCQRNWGKRT
jgi:hypothetical protein